MGIFFTCIILIGSGLVLLALFLMLAEKRRMHDIREDVKEKKEDLIRVIEDAEQLVEEMNKFSDYVVSNLEIKNGVITKLIEEADYRIDLLNGAICSQSAEGIHKEVEMEQNIQDDEVSPIHSELLKKGKVIPFDIKRREIIKLSRNGMDSTQIAKLLNIGKGEIELIAKMGK